MHLRQILLRIRGFFSPVSKLFSKDPAFYPSYILVENKIDEMITMTGIRITEGKYTNLVFSLPSKVTFSEAEDGSPKLTYQHQVEYLPPGMIIDGDLSQIIGDIIVDTIARDLSIGP